MFQIDTILKSDQNIHIHTFTYEVSTIDYYGDLVEFSKPTEAVCRFYKVQDKLFLNLKVDVCFVMKCARCLQLIEKDVMIEKDFQLIDEKLMDQQIEDENEEDFLYFESNQLDLEQIVHEQILLSIPLRLICDRDCRGICSDCGNDLNFDECSCMHEKIENDTDPRMEKLKDWYQKG